MTAIAYYLLKMLICSGILFLYYHVALRNKMFHQWNRFYLLSAVVLSLLLPLLQFKLFTTNENGIVYTIQSADNYLEAITIAVTSPKLSPEQWLATGYALISVLILFSIATGLLKIRKLINSHTVQEVNEIRFVNTTEPGTPFSFLRYIFWHRDISLQSETGQQIFQHELVHIQEKHTLDKLFVQAVLMLFWCNPFFWLMRRELHFIHEFIADKKSVGQHGAAAFSAMILQAAYPQQYNSIINPFFQKSIKRRLVMLTKIQNPKRAYLSRVVTLLLVSLVFFAFTVRSGNEPETSPANLPIQFAQTDTIPAKTKQIESVDVNSTKKIITINYTDGSCETLTEKQATDRGLINNNAINSPKQPRSVEKPGSVEVRLRDSSVKPLVVVDGEVVSYQVMSVIDPKKIKSINVLKGASATEKYGKRGETGVIEIITKAPSQDALEPVTVVGKPLAEKDLSAVVVEGKPMKTGDSSHVNLNENNNKNTDLKEVTVIGYPSRRDPVFEQTETPASIDITLWRSHLEKQLLSYIKNAASRGMVPGHYIVNVRFLVEKDGSVSDVKALNDPGYGLAAGAIKTVRIGPKWKPAEQIGKPVRSYHTQPITFMIQDQ